MSLRLLQWKRIPCRFSSNRCKGSLRLRTQRAFASLFFSASLLLFCFPLDVEATQEQDIAAIASILSNWDQAGYVASTPYTFPFGMTIAEYLMYASGWSPSYQVPASETLKGLLEQILQKPSSAWSTNDVLAVLSALNGISSNLVSSSSGGFDSDFWTNALINTQTRYPWLSEIGHSTDFGLLDQNNGNPLLRPQYDFFRDALSENVDSSGESFLPSEFADFFDIFTQYDRALRVDPQGGGDALATYSFLRGISSTALSQMELSISDVLNVELNNAVEYLVYQLSSRLDDISGNPHVIGPLSNTTNLLSAIHFGDLGYAPTDRSVQQDFAFLFQVLGLDRDAVTTNNIAKMLERLYDPSEEAQFVYETNRVIQNDVAQYVDQANSDMAVSSNQVATVSTNSPDFEAHQYTESNPIDTGDNIFNLPRNQFNAVTPSLPDSSDRTIVLFQGGFPIYGGNGGTRSATRSVRLDISYPLADHDAVSNGVSMMRSIMEWVWEWVFLILSVRMLFAFYASLTESRDLMNSGVGGLSLN